MEGTTCVHCARPIGCVVSWTVTADGRPAHQYCMAAADRQPDAAAGNDPSGGGSAGGRQLRQASLGPARL